MSQTTAGVEWTIGEEVQAFAEEQGVAGCLPAILSATQKIFPSARKRAVTLQEDREAADLAWIVIEVAVSMSVPLALAARRQWHEAVRRCCPAPLLCAFTLSLDLVE